ncbi:hypothetical protein [Conexibacter sp. SYSU D00693]|uniref:hypothetical protein n=1 Tax=Conexibacter sp. SYSU D00693 TaxID=2812560 RepID=UPI00196A58A8|nr:hypothetical protein [Conexibacter sp. SYSU D00693]
MIEVAFTCASAADREAFSSALASVADVLGGEVLEEDHQVLARLRDVADVPDAERRALALRDEACAAAGLDPASVHVGVGDWTRSPEDPPAPADA